MVYVGVNMFVSLGLKPWVHFWFILVHVGPFVYVSVMD